jgi:hypothetical protein
MCGAPTHVRFAPNSDRESEFPHKVMSALPPKADMERTRPVFDSASPDSLSLKLGYIERSELEGSFKWEFSKIQDTNALLKPCLKAKRRIKPM